MLAQRQVVSKGLEPIGQWHRPIIWPFADLPKRLRHRINVDGGFTAGVS